MKNKKHLEVAPPPHKTYSSKGFYGFKNPIDKFFTHPELTVYCHPEQLCHPELRKANKRGTSFESLRPLGINKINNLNV